MTLVLRQMHANAARELASAIYPLAIAGRPHDVLAVDR